MHGFPDNLHLYDRLVPHLSGRRVVTFDFLGWGGSDKPERYPYTADNQTRDLDAVIGHLGLEEVVLVAHDARDRRRSTGRWRIRNAPRRWCYSTLTTVARRPPAARSDLPLLHSRLEEHRTLRLGRFDLFRRIYWWQVGRRFIRDEEVREEFVPLLYEQFAATPSTKPAFFTLNNDLLGTVRSRAGAEPEMRAFGRPVRIIFGEADRSLNAGVGPRLPREVPGL